MSIERTTEDGILEKEKKRKKKREENQVVRFSRKRELLFVIVTAT